MTRRLRLLVATVALLVSPAGAAGDEVVGDCSNDTELRAKLDAIQQSPGSTLTFACGTTPVTIVLTEDLPSIAAPTVIDGGRAIRLSGADARRIFAVQTGAQLTLRHIALTRGFREADQGGAVLNGGTLKLDDVIISNSSAAANNGGAIWSGASSRLDIRNSTIASNAAANGGAIFADAGAEVTILGTVFADNSTIGITGGLGGAIFMWEGARVTIEGGEFRDNRALGGGAVASLFPTAVLNVRGTLLRDNQGAFGGGAIHLGRIGNFGSHAGATLVGVTLSGNASQAGGAILCRGTDSLARSALTIEDSTLSGNIAGLLEGGGILGDECNAVLDNVTVAGNRAVERGGGLRLTFSDSFLTNVTISGNEADTAAGLSTRAALTHLINATLAGNTPLALGGVGGLIADESRITFRNTALASNPGGNCAFVANTDVRQAFSLSSDDTCGFDAGRNGVDLLLDPLADNGGPTRTHLPRAGSPAIDGGTTEVCPGTDQRGAPRPFGASCDVGAVEVGAAPPTTTTTTVATSFPTTTTLPGGTCAPVCDTADPCRPQVCVQGACAAQAPTGIASASCACQRAVPAACAGSAIPAKIVKTTGKACALLGVAASAEGDRRLRKLSKAGRKWVAASRLLSKKPAKRVLSEACTAALEADYDDAGNRVDLLLDAGDGGG